MSVRETIGTLSVVVGLLSSCSSSTTPGRELGANVDGSVGDFAMSPDATLLDFAVPVDLATPCTTVCAAGQDCVGATCQCNTSSCASGCCSGRSCITPSSGACVAPFPFPPVVANGGPVLTAPQVITITFAGDVLATPLATFGAQVASSSYWDAIRSGYCVSGSCVGDGPAGTAVRLPMVAAPAYADADVQSLLQSMITSGQVPAPGASTIYTIYFPASTTITYAGGSSCTSFVGYHGSFTFSGLTVVYAVVNECAPPMMTPPITLLQNTTVTASHELIEASTDPVFGGFNLDLTNPATFGWADVAFSEVGDLCVDPFGLGQDETTENGFTVQRSWSKDNAALGKNPCVPIPPGEVYFNVYSQYSVVLLDVGQSKTIAVNALADGPMGPWTLKAEDWSDPNSTSPNPYLSFSLQGAPPDGGADVSVQSGDQVQLTITLLADPAKAPFGEADGVLVSANGTAKTATAAHFWPFIVLTPGEAADLGISMMRHVPSKISRPTGWWRPHVRR